MKVIMQTFFFALFLFTLSAVAQVEHKEPPPSSPNDFNWKKEYGKSTTKFTVTDWQPIIDARWGEGIPTAAKLSLFNQWWNWVDRRYGGFWNHDVNIDEILNRYQPEIAAGVSRGRFAGIMSHFGLQLMDLHTWIFDIPVRNTPLNKGTPLMVIGQLNSNRHFGAALTTLPDSSLLVYKAAANHPIGLEPGDLVLGYDGMLWKDIYPNLIAAELPLLLLAVNGSTPESNHYYIMQAAGLNWHLFDTIDIVKYSTGDTLHFSTNLLAGQSTTVWGSEQIDVPGVTWPDRNVDRVSWGIVDNTNIGYVYVTSWSFDAQFNIRVQFRNAIDSLMHHVPTDGMILDFRFNTGGGALARDGLELLFNTTVPTVGFDIRSGTTDRFDMIPDPLRPESALVIQGDPNTFYDKPIAVLIGPNSISSGELEAIRTSFHPHARLFGRNASGGNSPSRQITFSNSDWFSFLTDGSVYLVSTHEYLVHVGTPPDEYVWFDRDDVANGIDTVVESAISWIDSETSISNPDDPTEIPERFEISAFPNPFNGQTIISYLLAEAGDVQVTIYNSLGQEVRALLESRQTSGEHQVVWDGRGNNGLQLTSGKYIVRVAANNITDSMIISYVK
ncbi:MAG: FlgD immunoglobulin-like domain containing protein [Calditrichia bacterium]